MAGAGGEKYLFTGDTMFVGGDGAWSTFVIPGVGDAAALTSSLQLLGTLEPDIVISSAFNGETAVHVVGARWSECVAQALDSVPVTS